MLYSDIRPLSLKCDSSGRNSWLRRRHICIFSWKKCEQPSSRDGCVAVQTASKALQRAALARAKERRERLQARHSLRNMKSLYLKIRNDYSLRHDDSTTIPTHVIRTRRRVQNRRSPDRRVPTRRGPIQGVSRLYRAF